MSNDLQPLRLIYIRSGTIMAPGGEGRRSKAQGPADLGRRLPLGPGYRCFPYFPWAAPGL